MATTPGPRDRALAHLLRGHARYRAGRYLTAVADLDAAAEGGLAVADAARFLAAEAAFHTGDYPGAARRLRELMKRHPHTEWRHRARFRLADCDRAQGKLKPARQQWKELSEDYPEYPHPVALRLAQAELELALEQPGAAAVHLHAITTTWPRDPLAATAAARLDTLEGHRPQPSPAVLLETGEDLRRRKFFPAALDLLQRILTHPKADEATRRRARVQIGRALLQAERLDEALATFDGLVTATGVGRTAQFWRSEVLTRLGRDGEAERALLAAAGRTPDRIDPETREKLAWLAFHGGDYPSAQAHFAAMGNAVGPWMRAWLAWRAGRYAEARDGFLRLVRGSWLADKHTYWAARAEVQLGRFDEARKLYLQVFQRFPGSYYAWQARARLTEMGHPPPPSVARPCEGNACDPRDAADDPFRSLQALAAGWSAVTGLQSALEYRLLGLNTQAMWHLRSVRDELIAHGQSGRPRRWAFQYRPFVDNRPDEPLRGEWGRLLDEPSVPSDKVRTEGLREARGQAFNALIEEAFAALGDHFYVRRLAYGEARPKEPPEDPAHNAEWRLRFARAFRPQMEARAAEYGLDPHLLWAFMAVESSFNPWAISRASARGLMQVMPHTGGLIADRMGQHGFGTALLFEPEIVIEMAAWYVAELLEKFDGQLPLAIAAYNAGPHRVAAWLDAKGQLPMDEFIEEIPFDEAREYTKKVLRHLVLYHRTYQGRSPWPVSQVIDPRYRDNINF